jgi:heavy metal efflux pump (cobalt-zinc-cadmium)
MIESIISWCVKNRTLVLILFFFSIFWGIRTLPKIPLDAIPDLSDTQVLIYLEWDGRSPETIELQATYPVVSALISSPRVKSVRGMSFFGFALVFVIFEDGVDIYWARSRVLEFLQGVDLPEGVRWKIGPDATGVGWGFQYALVDKSGNCDLSCLRTLNDWYIKYVIRAVPGVAEVESVGGFVKQYQIIVDPVKLISYNITVDEIIRAVRASNNEVGGRLIESSGVEYFIRGKGFISSKEDIENIPVDIRNGIPVFIKDLAHVSLGPDIRRGVAELDGEGEVVGGIVTVRFGENLYKVVQDVKKKIAEIKNTLPGGVEIVTTYDRSDLIERSVKNLLEKILEECILVAIICALFLFNFRSALIIVIMLPTAVILSFIAMYYLRITQNIMSLAGIAIAIGTLVDAMIIIVENVNKKIEEETELGNIKNKNKIELILEATKSVGRPIFFTLLVITVSFLPVLFLEAQEGRLFKPLAITKTLAMLVGAFVAITFTPAFLVLFAPRKVIPEDKNPISKILHKLYEPVLVFALRLRYLVVFLSFLITLSAIPLFLKLGTEFMPTLNEGTILYMPTTFPGISIGEASRLLQVQDKIIKSFPEVLTVFGKVGRADTPLDPAPLSMIETTVILRPEQEWPCRVEKKYKPEFLEPFLKKIFGHCRRWTYEELISAMDSALQFSGVVNAWTMPIKGRIDMITTGIRTPLGIKIFGQDLKEIEKIGEQIEVSLKELPWTRSVYSERVIDGYYVEFEIKKDVAARYGLRVEDIQNIIETAIGGKIIAHTIEGRERYPIQLRYARDFREDISQLKRVLVPTKYGNIPIEQVAEIKLVRGPSSIKTEKGYRTGWVYIDVQGIDLGTYVAEAQKILEKKIKVPQGYFWEWSGQYEYILRVREKLKFIIPLTIMVIFFLLYINLKSISKVLIVFCAVPFSLVGALILLHILGYNLSVAVWVGIIALLGLDAETGVVMLLYLDMAYERWREKGIMRTEHDLQEAVIYGAVKRLRPKAMTVLTNIVGLLPIMLGMGPGADVAKKIAAPMVGGLITSFILELIVYPAIFFILKEREVKKRHN